MKLNDYWRLAKISLKARKKSTRSTVRGMSISLIIIVPLIFAMIAVYSSILPQLNKNPEALYAVFTSSQQGFTVQKTDENGYYQTVGTNENNIRNYMTDANAVAANSGLDMLHYTTLSKVKNVYSEENSLNDMTSYYERISIEGDSKLHPLKMPLPEDSSMGYSIVATTKVAVVDKSTLGEIKNPKYKVTGDKYNKGFTGDGKKQVIVSTRYLNMAGLKADDVYGKKISVYVREDTQYSITVKKDDVSVSLYDHWLFRDFEVVGVFGADNAKPLDENDAHSHKEISSADIIISSASYYGADGKPAIKYEYSYDSDRGDIVCNISDLDAKNNMAYEYFFAGAKDYSAYSYVTYYEYNSDSSNSNKTIYYLEKNLYNFVPDAKSANAYGQLNKALGAMHPAYTDSYKSLGDFKNYSGMASEFYTTFLLINNILTYAMIGGLSFAGIILFAALVNLFNTIMHSVSSRQHYLGVMRAIGARSSTIPKLYLFEVLRVFVRAFIWIAIIGGGICIGLKILFDQLFKGGVAFESVVISISWASIPLALLIIMAILLLIGVAYSVGCSWRMSRRPIMEVLEG